MLTILTESPIEAAGFIKFGGVVAFPTETVYGLGADVFNRAAIAKIFAAKRRPNDNPLIAHVGNLEQIETLVSEITSNARKFIEAFFPAPLTLVLPKAENVPYLATANLETIGVRMPKNELAREFIKACGVPLVAPSANLSGKPSPTNWQAVYEDLNGRIDCILQGAATEIGLESTVVDCTGDVPLILRNGAVTLEQLREIIPETRLYQLKPNEQPKSPGLKHKHYAPTAKVALMENGKLLQMENGKWKTENEEPKSKIQSPESSAFIGLNKPFDKFAFVKICGSVEEYAHDVFAFFRECDTRKIDEIYCETVAEAGIGAALMDRLKRASEN